MASTRLQSNSKMPLSGTPLAIASSISCCSNCRRRDAARRISTFASGVSWARNRPISSSIISLCSHCLLRASTWTMVAEPSTCVFRHMSAQRTASNSGQKSLIRLRRNSTVDGAQSSANVGDQPCNLPCSSNNAMGVWGAYSGSIRYSRPRMKQIASVGYVQSSGLHLPISIRSQIRIKIGLRNRFRLIQSRELGCLCIASFAILLML